MQWEGQSGPQGQRGCVGCDPGMVWTGSCPDPDWQRRTSVSARTAKPEPHSTEQMLRETSRSFSESLGAGVEPLRPEEADPQAAGGNHST